MTTKALSVKTEAGPVVKPPARPATDQPFNRAGHCLVCRQVAHDRTLAYTDVAEFFKQRVSTLKTWTTLQNVWLEHANSKSREIAWRTLQRTVNNRKAGEGVQLFVDYHGKRRVFRPLPPTIAPARWHGCVIAAWLYGGVIVGVSEDHRLGDYSPDEHITALNLRRQIEGKTPRPTTTR